MSGRKAWTDEELGFVQAHDDWSGRKLAEELGRTVLSVNKKRALIRSGWSPQLEAWHRSEDDFLLANPRMKAADVGAHLGRTWQAVSTRRRALTKDVVSKQRFGGNLSPTSIGARPLLAKTCPDCGLLLQAAWFGAKKGGWGRNCSRCRAEGRGAQSSTGTEKYRRRKSETHRRYQELTIPGASQKRQPWTEADFEVLRNPDMTVLQKALVLHRTYSGTTNACLRNGFMSKIGLGDPERDQWMIDNPNADRFDEIAASLAVETAETDGSRKSSSWDWDDADWKVSA